MKIVSIASAVPETVVSNDEIEARLVGLNAAGLKGERVFGNGRRLLRAKPHRKYILYIRSD